MAQILVGSRQDASFKKQRIFTRVVREIFNSTKMNEHLKNAKGKAKSVRSILIRDFTKATRQMLLHCMFNWPRNQLRHLMKSRLCDIVDAASTL